MSEQLQTVIFFIRHGETDLPYSTDPKVDSLRILTERGVRQSLENGQYLEQFDISAIFSSPLKRTMSTAEAVKQGSGFSGEIMPEPELLEIYDQRSFDSVKTRIPNLFRRLINDYHGKHIACVSHQEVIETTLEALGVINKEANFPCGMGEMYRLVFAGETFVQATKLTPAHEV